MPRRKTAFLAAFAVCSILALTLVGCGAKTPASTGGTGTGTSTGGMTGTGASTSTGGGTGTGTGGMAGGTGSTSTGGSGTPKIIPGGGSALGGMANPGPAAGGGTGMVNPTGQAITIVIRKMAFTPADVTVKVGDTVVFENRDGVAHLPRIDHQLLGQVTTGQKVEWRATKVGLFPYACALHPTMTGQVTVQ